MEKMMKRRWITGLFLLMLALMLAPDRSQAQDMKIGYVEPRAILDRMPEMRAVEQRMQNFVERKRQELTQQEGALQQELEAFQQKIGVISENARQQEEERLGQMQFELQQSQNQVRQEIQQRQAELMSPLLEQVQESIDVVAQEKGLDYVLNTTTSTGDVVILYVKEEIRDEVDITEAVMEHLGI